MNALYGADERISTEGMFNPYNLTYWASAPNPPKKLLYASNSSREQILFK
jgi:hypothetical protein